MRSRCYVKGQKVVQDIVVYKLKKHDMANMTMGSSTKGGGKSDNIPI